MIRSIVFPYAGEVRLSGFIARSMERLAVFLAIVGLCFAAFIGFIVFYPDWPAILRGKDAAIAIFLICAVSLIFLANFAVIHRKIRISRYCTRCLNVEFARELGDDASPHKVRIKRE